MPKHSVKKIVCQQLGKRKEFWGQLGSKPLKAAKPSSTHQEPVLVVNPQTPVTHSQKASSSNMSFECKGIDATQYGDLMFGNTLYNSNFNVIGTQDNNILKSIRCKKCCGVNGICTECDDLEKTLKSKMETQQRLCKEIEEGKIPPPKSMICFPLLLYSLLSKLVTKLKHIKETTTEDEQQVLDCYRKARESYESTWENVESKTIECEIETCSKKVDLDKRIEPTCNPPKLPIFKPFTQTFFMKFLMNQLRNYSRHPRLHTYSEEEKRFWLVGYYFCGKQLFTTLPGNKNQQQPCNWFNHINYNLIIPDLSTVKSWIPRSTRGYAPKLLELVEIFIKGDGVCKDVCISVDGMKVLKHFDVLGDQIVGSEVECKSVADVRKSLEDINSLAEEVLYFSMNAIDNSWHIPVGWFPIGPRTNTTNFIIDIFKQLFPMFKDKVSIICGCADAEIDAPKVQEELRKIYEDFIFINDYVHNFKNQRNVLFNRKILSHNISIQNILEITMNNAPLYALLDREELSPSDIMCLKPCLKLTSPDVVQQLRKVNTNEAIESADYLALIRDTYDMINDNKENFAEKLIDLKTKFQSLKNYPIKTKNICVHTLNGFIFLANRYPKLKPSCLTTNHNELYFSVIRKKHPRPNTKQLLTAAFFSYYIYLVMHACDDVRGFSLPNIALTDHYNGMIIKIPYIPLLSLFPRANFADIIQTKKQLESINENVACYARKTTLRMESCAPKRIFLTCPEKNCCKQKPYIIKGSFTNHLIAKHTYSPTKASEVVRQLECKAFYTQSQKDSEERKQSVKNNVQASVVHKPLSIICRFHNMSVDVVYNCSSSLVNCSTLPSSSNRKLHTVIVDLETTGFDEQVNSLIQLAFFSLASYQLHSIFVRPPDDASWSTTALTMHQEKCSILDESPFLQDVISDICKYLTCNYTCDVVLVFHSTRLDRAFFEKAISDIPLHGCKVQYCHTMRKSFIGKRNLEANYKENVSKELPGPHHNAVVDVVMLLDLLLKRFKSTEGIVEAVEKHL